MSEKDQYSDLADILDAVVVYEKDAKDYGKKKTQKAVGGDLSTSLARKVSSADDQINDLSEALIEGSGDQNAVRKRLSAILKSGDPITEAKTTMVVIARKEMEKLLAVVDAIDKLEIDLISRVAGGDYEGAPAIEISILLDRLEKSMARGLTVISKVIDNPAYTEFLLAYRSASSDDKEMSRISKVAQNKESREKLRVLVREIAQINEKEGSGSGTS
jgi:septal ring factor EnvC (AmiA/AmiB activator)